MENKMTKFRWTICIMLFVATTVNYLDRQVLSLTFPDFIKPEFHWSDADYGTITASFSLIYAIACLFAGKFIDWMGTKKGYLWAIFVWSVGACLHAACGIATCWFVNDVSSVEALRLVKREAEEVEPLLGREADGRHGGLVYVADVLRRHLLHVELAAERTVGVEHRRVVDPRALHLAQQPAAPAPVHQEAAPSFAQHKTGVIAFRDERVARSK